MLLTKCSDSCTGIYFLYYHILDCQIQQPIKALNYEKNKAPYVKVVTVPNYDNIDKLSELSQAHPEMVVTCGGLSAAS